MLTHQYFSELLTNHKLIITPLIILRKCTTWSLSNAETQQRKRFQIIVYKDLFSQKHLVTQ